MFLNHKEIKFCRKFKKLLSKIKNYNFNFFTLLLPSDPCIYLNKKKEKKKKNKNSLCLKFRTIDTFALFFKK